MSGKAPVAAQIATSRAEEGLLQCEYLAEDSLISINPMVHTAPITLIRGTYGPFQPSMTAVVPLWLALALKKVQRCNVIPPDWLSVTTVEAVVTSERNDTEELQPLNYYFFEISFLLLAHCPDDFDSPQRLRRAIEDLSGLRSTKLRRWMQSSVRDRVNAIKLNNLTMHEIQLHRTTLTRVLDDLSRIHVPGQESTVSVGTAPSSTGTGAATRATAAPINSTPVSETTPVAAPRRTLRRVIRRT